MGSKIYLHVGPPKTASTFLQKNFFKKISNKKCKIRPKVEINGRSILFHRVFILSVEVWNSFAKKILRRISKEALDEDKDLILSSEGFYGGFAIPKPWHKDRKKELQSDINSIWSNSGLPYTKLFANHLEGIRYAAKEIGFEDVRMIGVMRRQDQKIASGYAEMSSSIKGASQEHFEKWVKFIIGDPVGYYGMGGSKLDYYRWHKESSKNLGIENIEILPLELLSSDENRFTSLLADFMGINKEKVPNFKNIKKRRKNSDHKDLWYLRPPSRGKETLTFRIMKKLGLLETLQGKTDLIKRGKKITLGDDLKGEVLERYSESNIKLNKKVPKLNLKKYGYF